LSRCFFLLHLSHFSAISLLRDPDPDPRSALAIQIEHQSAKTPTDTKCKSSLVVDASKRVDVVCKYSEDLLTSRAGQITCSSHRFHFLPGTFHLAPHRKWHRRLLSLTATQWPLSRSTIKSRPSTPTPILTSTPLACPTMATTCFLCSSRKPTGCASSARCHRTSISPMKAMTKRSSISFAFTTAKGTTSIPFSAPHGPALGRRCLTCPRSTKRRSRLSGVSSVVYGPSRGSTSSTTNKTNQPGVLGCETHSSCCCVTPRKRCAIAVAAGIRRLTSTTVDTGRWFSRSPRRTTSTCMTPSTLSISA
ncbi:hypothetical protein HDK64DRAFT_332547, partial [Phyllosticta capitalensis]